MVNFVEFSNLIYYKPIHFFGLFGVKSFSLIIDSVSQNLDDFARFNLVLYLTTIFSSFRPNKQPSFQHIYLYDQICVSFALSLSIDHNLAHCQDLRNLQPFLPYSVSFSDFNHHHFDPHLAHFHCFVAFRNDSSCDQLNRHFKQNFDLQSSDGEVCHCSFCGCFHRGCSHVLRDCTSYNVYYLRSGAVLYIFLAFRVLRCLEIDLLPFSFHL